MTYRIRRLNLSFLKKKPSTNHGFTIVELLIVIVIIGILAALVIVVFNGVQTRAKNAKTVNAVQAWVKAIRLYKEDTGNYPSTTSCLGNASTYPDNRCASLYSWFVQPAFTNVVGTYIKQLPEPDITEVNAATSDRVRGAFYIYDPATPQVLFVQVNTSVCPPIGGLTYNAPSIYSDGVYCRAQL